MGAPYWIGPRETNTDSAWNHCILGEADLPGTITVRVKRSTKVDVQNPKGSDGAYVVDEGNDPATVTIDVLLRNEVDWEAWQLELPKITSTAPGKKREPLDISHPECSVFGVNSVYVTSISGEPPTAKGGKAYTIECVEYLPEPKKPKKKAKKGTAAKPVAPSALNAANLLVFSNFTSDRDAYIRDQNFDPVGPDAMARAFAPPQQQG